jgi:hypothetical protein
MPDTIHIPVSIHVEDLPYSKSVIEAMRVIDPVSSLWTNLLNEIERVQPDDEENPTQRRFVCGCGATVVWKAWRHDDGVFCDVCGKWYAVDGIDALVRSVTLEAER